jgi:hypothetical protein
MLHKLHIALAATILALAAVSAVDSASAGGLVDLVAVVSDAPEGL